MKRPQNKPIAHLSLLASGLIVRLMLRTLGFKRTLNLITATPTTSNHHTTKPLASRIPYLTCLEDSLAKIREIRKAGHGATLFIGVMGAQDYKFHAWLQEHDGKDVTLKFVKMNPENINPSTENANARVLKSSNHKIST